MTHNHRRDQHWGRLAPQGHPGQWLKAFLGVTLLARGGQRQDASKQPKQPYHAQDSPPYDREHVGPQSTEVDDRDAGPIHELEPSLWESGSLSNSQENSLH